MKMEEKTISRTIWNRDIETLTNPKKYFEDEFLIKISPYIIKTGIGFKVDVELRHDCDCEYCDHIEYKTLVSESMEQLEKIYKEQDFYVSDPKKFKDCKIDEIYYAKAINQKESVF